MKLNIIKLMNYLIFIILISQLCQCGLMHSIRTNIIGPLYETKIVYISENFSPLEIQQIEGATQEWSQTTHNIIKFELQYNFIENKTKIEKKENAIVVLKIDDKNPLTIKFDKSIQEEHHNKDLYALAYCDGNYNDTTTIFMIEGRISSIKLYHGTVLHEFGHALGLGHDASKESIMYHISGESVGYISLKDLENFCKLYFCNPYALKENR